MARIVHAFYPQISRIGVPTVLAGGNTPEYKKTLRPHRLFPDESAKFSLTRTILEERYTATGRRCTHQNLS